MEQANKPRVLTVIGSGLLTAVFMGGGRYLSVGSTSAIRLAFAEFLAVIGWLLMAATVVLMVLWAAKSVRS